MSQSTVPTTSEIRANISDVSRQKSYATPLALFVVVAFLYVATFVGACVASYWQLLFIPLNGLSIGLLFIIGHDACHGSYTPKRWLNKWIGRVSFLPSLWPYESWRLGHNYWHHGFTCLKGKDYPWQPKSWEDYSNMSFLGRWLERHYKSFPGLATNSIVDVWLLHGILPRRSDREFLAKVRGKAVFDFTLVFAFFLFECTAAVTLRCHFLGEGASAVNVILGLVLGILLPFWIWSFIFGLVIFPHHTHPQTVWFATHKEWSYFGGQVHGTVHFKFPYLVDKLFLAIMDHTAHHTDPGIPLYNLKKSQVEMESAYPENVTIETFSISTLRRIFAACQLYDFEQHCWLDFRGNRTSEPVNLSELYKGHSDKSVTVSVSPVAEQV